MLRADLRPEWGFEALMALLRSSQGHKGLCSFPTGHLLHVNQHTLTIHYKWMAVLGTISILKIFFNDLFFYFTYIGVLSTCVSV